MNLFINSFEISQVYIYYVFKHHLLWTPKTEINCILFRTENCLFVFELIFLEYTTYRDVYDSGHETIYFSGEAHEYWKKLATFFCALEF